MANGDAAAADGMDVVSGSAGKARQGFDEVNKTRDYIAGRLKKDFSNVGGGAVPIANGGTGATSAAAARTSLDVVGNDQVVVSDGSQTIASMIPRYSSGGGLVCAIPTAANGVTPKTYVDAAVDARLPTAGGTVTGLFNLPNADNAQQNYSVMYWDGSRGGRVCKAASSARFKKNISDQDPAALGDLFPAFKRFQMREGGTAWKYGYIAEELAANPATEPFVVYAWDTDEDGNSAPRRDGDGNLVPESISFIELLLAQNAQLNARLEQLEARS